MAGSVQEIAALLDGLRREIARIRNGQTSPQLSSSSLEDGSIPEYDADGVLVGRIGKQPDGSHTHVVLEGPTPTQPTPAVLVALALEIEVGWDGNLADPTIGLYADFEAVEVHVGGVADFEPTRLTLRGEIRSTSGGSVGVPSPAGVRWVRLVIRSQAGKRGPASVATPVTVPALVDTGQFDTLADDLALAEAEIADARVDLDTAFPGGAFDVEQDIEGVESAASGAQSTADNAMTTANGKNTIYSSLDPAPSSGAGYKINDWWKRRDAAGVIIGTWRLAGNYSWTAETLGDAVLNNLDVTKLTASGASIQQAVIDKMAVQLANIIEANIGNLTVTGAAQMSTIVAEAIAAQTAEFLQISAEQILAGDITVRLTLQADGEFQVGAGDVGLGYIQMQDGTMTVWDAAGADGQAAQKLIEIGRNGRGLWTVTDAEGGILSQIRDDGTAAFTELDVEALRISGVDVADAITSQPRVITNEIYPDQSPQYDNNFGNYEIAFEAEPNHMYELETFGNVRTDGNSIRISGRYKESTTGSPSMPDRNSPETSQSYPQEAGSQYRIAGAKFYYRTTSSNMKVRLLTCFEPNTGGKWAQVSYWRHILRDLGLDEGETIGQANSGGAVPMGSTTPDPTPTLPPLKEYTETWNFESHTLWTQNGRVTGSQYHPSWMRSGMGGSSRYRGYMWLPQAFRDERDIAEEISSIEVYLAVAEVGAAVAPAYGTSNSTTMTTEPGSGNFNTRNPYSNDRKSGWEYMTGATRNGLDGTATMLAIGDKVSNANLVSFHGPSASVSLRPKIRMTYKKRG